MKFVSPGTYVIEKDISEYPPSINSSVVGIVGFASKGPTNKATLITSQQQLVELFGEPNEAITGQGLEAALEILEATNQVYYVRCADTTSGDASSTVSFGGCPSVMVSANEYGVTQNLYLTVQVYDNNGTAKYSTAKNIDIASGTVGSTVAQAVALKNKIGGALDTGHVGAFYDSANDASGYIVGAYAGSGSYMTIDAYSDSDRTLGTSALFAIGISGEPRLIGDENGVSSVSAYGSTILTSVASYVAQTLYPGAGYNAGTKVGGSTSGLSVEIDSEGGPGFVVTVNENGAAKENYKANFINSGTYIEDVINTGETNLKSEIIKGEIYFSGAAASPTKLTNYTSTVTDFGLLAGGYGLQKNQDNTVSAHNLADPRFVKMVEGTYNFVSGNNGIPTSYDSTLIGDATLADKTGMQALDDDALNISIAIVPGITAQAVQNALITLAEGTQNFMALVAPPYAVGNTQNAIDWTNGLAESRTTAINSSFAACYWPWVKTYSVFDGADRWYDPVIYGARQMVYTDSVAEPWFAPAGFQRGRLTKPSDVEVKLNQGDRDSMYSGGNVVNPIVNFIQQGITIFGQRTTQREATSLDRINVRRLMIQVRKIILAATRRYVHEPNDEFTWQQITEVLNPMLDDIKRRRGITEFQVVCDGTVNTAVRIDRNEMWCKVLIKPTKTAEILVFEINLTNQSAQIGS